MVKIKLVNPITQKEIDRMIQQLLKISKFDLLMIDYGNHNFESIDVIRYCRLELGKVESILKRFNKIAFLSTSPYKRVSENPNRLRCFHSENEAIEWLLLKSKINKSSHENRSGKN